MKLNCISTKTALAVVTLSCAAQLHAPPAIADSNLENLIKTAENAFGKIDSHDVTQNLSGTRVNSAYMKLFDTVNQAFAVTGIRFEDVEYQRLLLDYFSGDILRSVYDPSISLSKMAGTAASEMSRFVSLRLEKHSGGDPHLVANKRADIKLGFDPYNFCINHTPPVFGGNASD